MPSGYSKLTGENPFKGKKRKPFSKEHREKISLTHKNKSPWNKGLTGFKHSKSTKKLMSESRKGIKHWNWQGGITPLIKKIRRCFEYKEWRSNIFERDNYTCQQCNKIGGDLNADHYPKLFSEIIKNNKINNFQKAIKCLELWDINNGRTLCVSCHRKTFTKNV